VNLIRAYQRCACLLVLLGITSFTVAANKESEAAPLLAVIGLPGAAAAWWLSVRGYFLLSRWAVNTLLTMALLYALLRLAHVNVEVISELVVFIQIIKIGDRRSPRDDAQILSLAVFLAIAAMLTSNAFWVGIQLIVFVPLLAATVMLFQIYSGWFAASGGVPVPSPQESQVAAMRAVGRSLRFVVVLSAFAASLMAVFIFVIMPRGVGENALGNWRPTLGQSVTGFTDHIKLGGRDVISESQRIVMEVLVRESSTPEEPAGANLGNGDTVYYLRGAVLDEYQNGAWAAPRERDQNVAKPVPDHDIPLGVGARASVQQDITMRGIGAARAPLFDIWRPVKILPGRDTETLHLDLATKTIKRTGRPGAFAYTVWSSTSEAPGVDPERRTSASFASPRIHDLAAATLIAGGMDPDPAVRPVGDDARAARLIESHLQRNYAYSLVEQPVPEGVDPIENFLFQTKEGHCEYFASAMAAMCRSVGINARVIAGYLAAEFNDATGRYVVREANAHAWIEAEAGEGRWHRYDPTPPADLARIHKPVPGLLGRLRRVVESAEYAWNASVVGFDEGARQRLLGPEDESHRGFLSRLDAIAERVRAAGPRHFFNSALTGITVFAAVAGIGLILQTLMVLARNATSWRSPSWWPSWRRATRIPGFDPAQAKFYERLLDLLARRGHAKPSWRPPLDHAANLAAADPSLATSVGRVANLYYRLRFAGRPLTEADQAGAEADLSQIAAPLRRR
jgi:hypothetical protein